MNIEDLQQRNVPFRRYEWLALAIAAFALLGLYSSAWTTFQAEELLGLAATAFGAATMVVSMLAAFYSINGDAAISKKLVLGSVIALLAELATLGVGLFIEMLNWSNTYF